MPMSCERARVADFMFDRSLGIVESFAEKADVLVSALDALEGCRAWVRHRSSVESCRQTSYPQKPQVFRRIHLWLSVRPTSIAAELQFCRGHVRRVESLPCARNAEFVAQ